MITAIRNEKYVTCMLLYSNRLIWKQGRKECKDEDLSNLNSDNDIWAAQYENAL